MKQIAEQCHRGHGGDSMGGQVAAAATPLPLEKCVSLVTVMHGFPRKRGGNFSFLLFNTQPVSGQSTCMSQIFVFREQRSH